MSKPKHFSFLIFLFCSLLPWNSTAVNQSGLTTRLLPSNLSGFSQNIEGMLAKTLSEVKQGQVNQALDTVDQLLKVTPNFKLGHAIKGDLLLAKTGAISQFANTSVKNKRQVTDLKYEAQKRLESYFDANKSKFKPNLLIQLSEQQHHVLVLDVTKSRLTIGKNGSDKKHEGDKRTPLGVYFASKKLNQELPDMYGIGAYPLNYPNEIDQYERRDGYGIWIHGTPSDTYSRAPRASDGCVVLSNPVSTSKYLSHYSKDFFSSKGDYQAWSAYKKRVLAGKSSLRVDVSNLSMFAYPTAKNPMVVVTFNQYFKSPTLKNRMVKRQYWIQEGKEWKIIYEGAA